MQLKPSSIKKMIRKIVIKRTRTICEIYKKIKKDKIEKKFQFHELFKIK